MAADDAGTGNDFTAARQTKIVPQMMFRRPRLGKTFHPLGHFDDAFLALAVFAARSRHVDAERFGVIEQRRAGRDDGSHAVEMQFDAHNLKQTTLCLQLSGEKSE